MPKIFGIGIFFRHFLNLASGEGHKYRTFDDHSGIQGEKHQSKVKLADISYSVFFSLTGTPLKVPSAKVNLG